MLISYLEILILFVLPPALYYFELINIKTRHLLFFLVCFLVIVTVVLEDWSLKDLGIRADNFQAVIVPYLIFLSLGILALIVYARILGEKMKRYNSHTPLFLLLLIPMSIGQEFIFRSFLMPKLGLIFSSVWVIVVVNALLFSFFHIIYKELKIILPLIFISGLVFAGMYYFYPNLILISAAHAILNPTAIYLGFFRLKSE